MFQVAVNLWPQYPKQHILFPSTAQHKELKGWCLHTTIKNLACIAISRLTEHFSYNASKAQCRPTAHSPDRKCITWNYWLHVSLQ